MCMKEVFLTYTKFMPDITTISFTQPVIISQTIEKFLLYILVLLVHAQVNLNDTTNDEETSIQLKLII